MIVQAGTNRSECWLCECYQFHDLLRGTYVVYVAEEYISRFSYPHPLGKSEGIDSME